MGLKEYTKEVNDKLFDAYGIVIGDCIDDEQIETSYKDGETPEQIVEWVGTKYDLTPIKEMV